jgi:hypothetical protein
MTLGPEPHKNSQRKKEEEMAKHDTDPVLQQLVHAVNQSGRARVPVTVSAQGTVVTGVLIAQEVYFAELAEGNPLLSALQPESGLLGKDYAKEVDAESAHHLHVRAGGKDEGLWRISLESVDGWTVSTSRDAAADEGPFARLLSR